jgi:hypothetical protein
MEPKEREIELALESKIGAAVTEAKAAFEALGYSSVCVKVAGRGCKVRISAKRVTAWGAEPKAEV